MYINNITIWSPKRYSYSDITVVCSEPLFENFQTEILLNPTVIFEILSPSTGMHDRGDKFAAYRQLESLQEYVLVSQHEICKRQDKGWYFSEVRGLEQSLILESIQCTPALTDFFYKVDFNQA